MAQLMILIFGAGAISMIASKRESVQKYGFLCGVISEPFWLYEAWRSGQWAVMLLALWWGCWYGVGLWKRL